MQKVVGSSPIIRFAKAPLRRGLLAETGDEQGLLPKHIPRRLMRERFSEPAEEHGRRARDR
jgi:hypothetical protein